MLLLQTKKVTKYFGGLRSVNEVDLSVEKGQILGLIGPNGAGKTTLFNILTGKIRPTRGSVIFKGKDITGLHPHAIVGLGLARSFQQNLLFNEMTVLENILVGFYQKSGMGLWNALINTTSIRRSQKQLIEKSLEIAHFLDLERLKDVPVNKLPLGYQRRLGIGIALATDPELLLMDEPSTGMNAEETKILLAKIKEMNGGGLTILLVAHDMKLVMNVCERLAVLSFGNKIAEGTPEEISSNREVISAYLGSEYAAGY